MNIKKIISILMSTLMFLQCPSGSRVSACRALEEKQGISDKAKLILGAGFGTAGVTAAGLIWWNFFHGSDVNNDKSISSLKNAIDANCDTNVKIQIFRKLLGHYIRENEKIDISADDVLHVCENISLVLDEEPNLLKIDGPTLMVGDTHSNVFDTKIYIEKFLEFFEKDSNTKILFLGDYVDRGQQCVHGGEGVKNLMILYTLKMMFPKNVFLLRGNHEDKSVCSVSYARNSTGGIVKLVGDTKKECDTIYGSDGQKLFDDICDTFKHLPIAAIVNKDTFCVHGGICPSGMELPNETLVLDHIKNIQRRVDEVCKDRMVRDLLWSDPRYDGKNEPKYYLNKNRGAGCLFNGAAVDKFLDSNNLKMVIRAHQTVLNGYEPMFHGKLITLFSSSGYANNNTAAMIYHEGKNAPLKVAALTFSKSQQSRQLSNFREI